jgi:Rrf2 family protein
MAKIVSYSEAASIGLHGMVLVARAGDTINVQEIADITGSSRHHVAKVMQRLVKEGFLFSNRGPSGGFKLSIEPAEITLLQIYEAIEVKIKVINCPHEKAVCPFGKCILGTVVSKMTQTFREHLSSNTLADMLE